MGALPNPNCTRLGCAESQAARFYTIWFSAKGVLEQHRRAGE